MSRPFFGGTQNINVRRRLLIRYPVGPRSGAKPTSAAGTSGLVGDLRIIQLPERGCESRRDFVGFLVKRPLNFRSAGRVRWCPMAGGCRSTAAAPAPGPALPPPAVQGRVPAVPPPVGLPRPFTVLVVDDDRDCAE